MMFAVAVMQQEVDSRLAEGEKDHFLPVRAGREALCTVRVHTFPLPSLHAFRLLSTLYLFIRRLARGFSHPGFTLPSLGMVSR